MGRPSKQKEAVVKYFMKSMTKKGKSEYFKCTFCLQLFAYNSWRMAKHLITCTKTTTLFKNSDLPIIKKLFSNNTNKEKSTSVHQIDYENDQSIIDNEDLINANLHSPIRSNTSLSNYSFLSNPNSINIVATNTTLISSSSKSIKLDRFIDRIINDKEQDDIWTTLARACYATATPLSFTENSYWIDAFQKIRPSLQLPNRHQLSNNLLNKKHKRIETIVNDKISSSKFLSIQLDGWSNIRCEPIVNIVLTTPEPVVYKIIDTGTNKHSATYMAKIIQEVIVEVSHEKIISVISDNAKNMVKSWEIVNEHYPESEISFHGCGAHILNLLCKDFVKLPTFKDIQTYTKGIIKEFKYSHFLKGLLNEFQKAEKESNDSHDTFVCLKLPVATRWGSETESLKSLLKNKQYLKQVAISSRATNILSKSSIEKILNNTFWDKIEMALNLLEPISKWITILESDSSSLSQTCIALHSIQMHLNEKLLHSFLTEEEENLIIQKLGKRITMALKKIHFAAHLLDGNNKGKCLDNSESIDAVKYISSLCARMNLNIPDILSELAMYRSCEGLWSKKFIWDSLKKRSDGTQIGLLTWWKGICSSSKLSQIAIAILSCPPTSASTERSFSTYGLIHTAKRNRLTNERAVKLVFIKHNLKLNDVPKQVKIGPCDDYIEPEMSELDEKEIHLYLSDSEDNEEN